MKLKIGAKRIQEVLDKDRFPYLAKLGISLSTDYDVGCILREISLLAEKVDSVNLYNVRYLNDRSRTALFVPRCSTKASFLKQVKTTHWLQQLIDALIPLPTVEMGDDADENGTELRALELDVGDENAVSRADAIRWTCLALADMNQDEFAKAADSRGLVSRGTKFSTEEFQAICEDANIGSGGQEMVRKHFLSKEFKIFPSKKKVAVLKKGALVPKTE